MGWAWLAPEAQSLRGRRYRRSFPIHMYVGRNGAAKSLAMVYDTLPDLEAGRRVLSTVRLLDYRNPRPCDDDDCPDIMHGTPGHLAAHPLYDPFTDWPQLLDFKGGAVLMDEVTGVADSNESAALPVAVGNKLAQLRRDQVMLRITALNFIRAHKRIREAVNAVTRCQSFMPVTVQDDQGRDQMWRQRRLAIWRTYDAQTLPVDDHTDSAYDKADLLVKARHWIPTSPAIRAYDTTAPVLMVGTVSDAGRCAHCGGRRQASPCTCSDYVDRQAAAAAARKARSADGAGVPVHLVADLRGRAAEGGR